MPVRYASVETAIGPMLVAHRDGRIVRTMLNGDTREFAAQLAEAEGEAPQRDASLPSAIAAAVADAVQGRHDLQCVDLDALRPFQRRVLEATAAIPAGEVRTYGQVAALIGAPGAARAVGTALARNPVPIVVPCHRVVRANGDLGNYSGPGGPGSKARLLEFEARAPR